MVHSLQYWIQYLYNEQHHAMYWNHCNLDSRKISMNNTMCSGAIIALLQNNTGSNEQHNVEWCNPYNIRYIHSTMHNTMCICAIIAILYTVIVQWTTQAKVLASLQSLNIYITMNNTMCSGAIIAIFVYSKIQWTSQNTVLESLQS